MRSWTLAQQSSDQLCDSRYAGLVSYALIMAIELHVPDAYCNIYTVIVRLALLQLCTVWRVLWHSMLRSVTKRFSLGTRGARESRGNWQTQVHLVKTIKMGPWLAYCFLTFVSTHTCTHTHTHKHHLQSSPTESFHIHKCAAVCGMMLQLHFTVLYIMSVHCSCVVVSD